MRHTNDGGINWVPVYCKTPNTIVSLSFVTSNIGWIVGFGGEILKTTNGGVTFIEEHNDMLTQPKEFLLEQNYPNPFNPSTKISWQVPIGSHQTLKIYDVLGNEIETLVNKEYIGSAENGILC